MGRYLSSVWSVRFDVPLTYWMTKSLSQNMMLIDAFSTICARRARPFVRVMSLAYFTTLRTRPSAPTTGLYEAWIQTSLPPFATRLNSPAWNLPFASSAQNLAYSGLATSAGSTNMRWCRPSISPSV
jgi:hypothetical protein